MHRLAEGLVAMRRVLLGEVAVLPGGVVRLAERLRLQAELRFDGGANHEAAIGRATARLRPPSVVPRPKMRHMSMLIVQ